MAFGTILTVLQSDEDAGRVLDLAVPLAAHHRAHLIGVHAEALPMAYASALGGMPVDFTVLDDEATERRLSAMRESFSRRGDAEGISYEWRALENVSGDSALCALESARTADLVVAPQTDPDAPSRSVADVQTLLFETGRPVLFVPITGARSGPVFERVTLAWNGSREAARAAFDALPFMKEARAVEILCIDVADSYSQDASVAGAEIAAALARHGIDVTFKAEDSGGVAHGQVIENYLTSNGTDLLVMGAYGQSRLKEFIFGGATSTLLKSMPVPTLMSR
jgi:nucleotide-binding universal stress UspA family protein